MLLFIPPTIDIDNTVTQVKLEVFNEQSLSSTCIDNAYKVVPEDFYLSNWKNNIYSTNLSLEEFEEQNNSTWDESELVEYEIVANFNFNKSFKVKSKIKSVTKYKPNIVID